MDLSKLKTNSNVLLCYMQEQGYSRMIDVSIDSRKDAYATLEDEKDKHSPKKWRNPSTSMRDIIETKQRLKA